jgi:GNAT superfamily N-acetyltransferase
MTIRIRKFDPDLDSGLIYSSCPKGVYYGAAREILAPKHEWFKTFFLRLKELLATGDVLVACAEDDPGFIIGYSIIKNYVLHFVYVKENYRNQGIAKALTQGKFKRVTNLTRVGKAISDRYGFEEDK